MAFDRDTLRHMWPRAPEALINGVISSAPAVFDRHKINTPLRLAHFLAQISHESDGGTITRESLDYTHASRIREVWPTRFPTDASAEPYVRNPEKLADKVYQGRMGNTQPGDGYRFSGRGLLQITGRDSYREIGTITGLDLVNNPDLAFAPEHALEVAAAEFEHLGCLPYCDRDDLHMVTERVNGGQEGALERAWWLRRWRPLVADVSPASWATPGASGPSAQPAAPATPNPQPDAQPAIVFPAPTSALQSALNALGFGPLTVDGVLGPKTKQAMQAFQRAKHLTADGILGPNTVAAIRIATGNPGWPDKAPAQSASTVSSPETPPAAQPAPPPPLQPPPVPASASSQPAIPAKRPTWSIRGLFRRFFGL